MEILQGRFFDTVERLLLFLSYIHRNLKWNTGKKYNLGNFKLDFIYLQQEFIHLFQSSCHSLDTIKVFKDSSFSCKGLGFPINIVVWTSFHMMTMSTTSVTYNGCWLYFHVLSPAVNCLVTYFLTFRAFNPTFPGVMLVAFLTPG